ncbi:MAG: response regulator [Desulfobacteraceae bacterium]|nr:MAG: response regulator [Desulfobacteraceae bacterium]
MKTFQSLSIKKKLTLIITITCVISLFLACMALITIEFFSFRQLMIRNNTTIARTIGMNCQAALLFNDQKAAQDTLSALHAVPDILYGMVYKPEGDVLARFISQNAQTKELPEISHRMQRGTVFHGNHLDLIEPIVMDQETIGYIFLQAGLTSLYARLYRYALICGVILLLSSLIAYFLSLKFQRTISGPILDLAEKMGTVTLKQDYSIRIESQAGDELGILFDGFNDMLTKIQERDEALYFTQYFIDHMDEPAFWTDTAGRFVYVNNSACTFWGYLREEMLTMDIHQIDPNCTQNVWKKQWKQLITRKSMIFESLHRKKSGDTFPVEVIVNYVEYKGKQYYCAFSRDISQRKLIESKLEQAQKLEAIGILTGGVAHDLNNILGGLVGYPEIILMKMSSTDPLRKHLISIKESGQKAAAIVQDLLTLARRGAIIHEVQNMNGIITDYMQSPEHEMLIRYHPRVEFKTDLDPDLLNNLGSSVHLTKMIMNLISNAAEAIQDQGNVYISSKNQYLDTPKSGFDFIPSGDYVLITISDTGKGISQEDQKKIFEPFYTKKTMGRSGTGLGMTVVRGTMEDHGGYIDILSMDDVGTKFQLYLPATRRGLKKKIISESIDAYNGKEYILVVDDVREQREIAKSMLNLLGYKVDTVASGEEAIEYMRNHDPDLIVLDMIMEPGIDGLTTYKKILEIKPGRKAVIASGFSETDRVKEAQRIGASAYIRKPYLIKKIGAAIREALDAKNG